MSKRPIFLAVAISALGLAAVGCGDDEDETTTTTTGTAPTGEPSREERITQLATAACARYADTAAGCPGYGTGDDQEYETETDCLADFQERATDMWSASECGSGQINVGRYRACEDRAKLAACSQGFIDTIMAASECRASEVCIDPPQ